jgi:hypothetical protein
MTFRSWLLILLVFAICLSCSAQIQQAWVAKYNNGITDGNHQALKMALDSSGNIHVLGVSANANTNTGYVVVKYAPNGNQVWAARYDSTNYPTASPTGFAFDSSNAVIVIGNAVTAKYSSDGNLLWTAPYNGQATAVDPGQNIYITGVSGMFTTMKLTSTGSNVWSETWVDQPEFNLSQAIAVDNSSNVYAAGPETYFYDKGPYVNIALLKYDLNGNQLWHNGSVEGVGGGTGVVGILLDGSGDVFMEYNFAVGIDGGYTTSKVNPDGSTAWTDYDPTGNGNSFASGLIVDSLGNIVISGQNAHSPPLPSYGTYKLDTNGNYLWTNLYPMSSYGGSAALALAVDSSNNIYVTGESSITNTPYDIATLKLDNNGNQLWVQRYHGTGLGNAGNAIAVDNSGNVYVAGYETETNGFTSMILIKYSPVTIQKQSSGNVIMHAYGLPGETFDVQASTNLETWQDLGDVVADTNGVVQFNDTNAPSFPQRFYYTVPQ